MLPPVPLGDYYPDAWPAQSPADVAVVTPTILRDDIERAIRSVYAQDFKGRIALAIGVDVAKGSPELLERVLADRPSNVSAVVLALPYSTSTRHGGVHVPHDGGALRSILGFMVNSRHVAFLDDDNEWTPAHLSGVMAAVQGRAWAFARRMLVDAESGRDMAVDRWDSTGVGKGRFASAGGFVDPNCLLIDKRAVGRALGLWADPGVPNPGVTSDRHFFRALTRFPGGEVEEATVRYRVRPNDILQRFVRENTVF